MPLTAYSVETILAHVAWTVEVTAEFERWWDGLTEDERISIDGMIRVLERHGPALGAPYSAEAPGSTYPLRQLRVPHHGKEMCVVYTADESSATLVLLIGTTVAHGDEFCPPEFVELAHTIYRSYLATRHEPH